MQKISKELQEAVKHVIILEAKVGRIKPIVEGHQAEWLKDNTPRLAKTWGDMDFDPTDASINYLWEDEDFQSFLAYTQERANEIDPGRKKDTCPLLMSKNQLCQARRKMLDEAQYLSGLEAGLLYSTLPSEKWEEAWNLIKGLVISAPKRLLCA